MNDLRYMISQNRNSRKEFIDSLIEHSNMIYQIERLKERNKGMIILWNLD